MPLSLDTMLSHFRGKRVLITGGLGFIGSNLARTLAGAGAELVLLDSLIPAYGGNHHNIADLDGKVRINIADVRDEHSLPSLLKGQDYLFNLAGQTSHLDSMHDPRTDLEINCRAQLSILEACRHHNPAITVVFASTRQIYGRPDRLPVDESHPIRPVDVNGINKTAGEQYHILYHNVYGIRTSVLRLTNTIGPRMRIKDARQTFLGVWIRQLLMDEPIDVWGGSQRRDFTYVDDVVNALLLAASNSAADGKVYNLGGCEVIDLKTLAELCVELNGRGRVEIKKFPPDRRRIDIGDYYGDYSLIKRELGWQPLVPLRHAITRILEYYRVNLPHYL